MDFSLAYGKPVLVLGGFGGCASLIAKFLLDIKATWPAELSPDSCKDDDRNAVADAGEMQALRNRFVTLQDRFREYRNQLHCGGTIYGLRAVC